MKALDFTKKRKQYFTVTLDDAAVSENGKCTTLMLKTPTKKVMDQLIAMQSEFSETQEETVSFEMLEELYSACSSILSCNKTGTIITADYVSEIMGIEEIVDLFSGYMLFVQEVANSKN